MAKYRAIPGLILVRLQVLVDIGTASEVFNRMDEAIGNHVTANPQDFTGEHSVHANVGADPMKLAMVFSWSYCYNCEFHSLYI